MKRTSSSFVSGIERLRLILQLSVLTSGRMRRVLDMYDFITRDHVEHVAGLARIAKSILGLSYVEGRLLMLLAWLHDLGKSINYNYLSILFTPRKLEYDDDNLIRLMIEHSSQSENKLDELGYNLPVKLRLAIRNHHRFLIYKGTNRDILLADPDYKELTPRQKKSVVRLLDIFMVLDFLCAYTEASRPSNWFDNIVIDPDTILRIMMRRYGGAFKINAEELVKKLLENPSSRKLLENNSMHNSSVIALTMKEWAEKTSIYDVNYVEILTCQIAHMRRDTDLEGFKRFLARLSSPVFSVILWEKWAEEVFSEIISASLENRYINTEIGDHLAALSHEHPHSLLAGMINKHIATHGA